MSALDGVNWIKEEETPDPNGKIPHVTHSGIIRFGSFECRVYQLSDGQRVFDADDVTRFFNESPELDVTTS